MTSESDASIEEPAALRRRLMLAALDHVPFEGWSAACFDLACSDVQSDRLAARRACPAGAVDLAVEFQIWGDERMIEELEKKDLSSMRLQDKAAIAVETRITVVSAHKEAVRKSAALFALPSNGIRGARLLWQTVDAIWNFLGDNSDDYNWYTKRALLMGVMGSSVLFWLGEAVNGERTRRFIDRRIRDVMRVHAARSRIAGLPGGQRLLSTVDGLARPIRPPGHRECLHPGWVTKRGGE